MESNQILYSLENAFTSAHRNLSISILLGHLLNPNSSSELQSQERKVTGLWYKKHKDGNILNHVKTASLESIQLCKPEASTSVSKSLTIVQCIEKQV